MNAILRCMDRCWLALIALSLVVVVVILIPLWMLSKFYEYGWPMLPATIIAGICWWLLVLGPVVKGAVRSYRDTA